jgi:hypothetical protein
MGSWVKLTPDGEQAVENAKTTASEAWEGAKLAGKDALRQMNPFRETPKGPSSAKPAVAKIPAVSKSGQQVNQMASAPPTYAMQATGSTGSTMPSGHIKEGIVRNGQGVITPVNALADTGGVPSQGGMRPRAGTDGSTTLTMGNKGQDDYGRVSLKGNLPKPGSTMLNDGLRHNVDGMRVTGDPNAVRKFGELNFNVNENDPGYQRWAAQNQAKGQLVRQYATPEPSNPLAKLPVYGSHGGGWKTRAKLYAADMDAYNKATGNQTELDIAQMKENGAGRRALLEAQHWNDQNSIAQQRINNEKSLNDARITSEGLVQENAQMDINQKKQIEDIRSRYLSEADPTKQQALGNQLLTMLGKSTNDWKITTQEESDPLSPGVTKKVSYAVNIKNPRQVVEIGGGSGEVKVAPADPGERVIGQQYRSPVTGETATWDGKRWVRPKT